MAEAVLEIVLQNLNSLIQKELGLLLGLDQDLKRLASLFATIKATLQDAEEKQFSNPAIKDWLGKLKDAAHILDDILDECAYEALGLEYQGIRRLSNKVQSSGLSSFHPKHVVFRYKIAKRMKRISERLKEIAEERTKFHLTEMVPERRSGVIEWRQTTSFLTEPQVYGREEDKDKIIDFLVASHSENLSVYPIVGLGGLGKTTLAQLIFNHERIVVHFELRIWVCVSEDSNLKRMTKAIIEAASGHTCEDLDLEPLQRKLQDLLQKKRYLLVLDDVWDDNEENWKRLKYILAYGTKGASILVTTRLLKVAAIMGTIPPHDLSILSDNDCWELFKQQVFGSNKVEQVELVAVGKEIVKKCGGVPLAAKALGGLLRFKRREEKEWLYVKESNLWSLPHSVNSVMSALRLSYLNLPIKLRQCFAYCAIFAKDEIIRKQYLIELWMANGFISANEILDVEDVGDGVWHELYWRSFFQDIETDEFGEVTSFKMHDLVHDLALSVAEEVHCITNDNDVSTLSDHRWTWKTSEEANSIQLHKVKSLRTCISPYRQLFPHVLKCYSLRVLHCKPREELSSSIGHLKHLRYLNLSGGGFETLPESLGKLWNLQILNLDNCRLLQKLPNSLIRLKAMQKLSLFGCSSLSSLPPQIGKLTSLWSLTTYFVGKERGFLLTELGSLKLKGDLSILHLGKVKSVMDAKEANMSSKKLKRLFLSWDGNEESELQENVEQILEVLQPHTQHLRTLKVVGYEGAHFPQWMSSPSLKYLTNLQLEECKSCLQLPPLWELPSLKYLRISNMIHVKYLYEESYHGGVVFMDLEFLVLNKLPNLIRLLREDGENMFPRLSTLHITKCPKLLGFPTLPSINDLLIEGKCNQDILSSIHKLSNLESLRFRLDDELTCFPDGMLQNLTSLKRLHFYGLSKLEVLPTEIINLNAVQELVICDCNSLKSLAEEVLLQGLPSLKKLEIMGCHKFNVSAGFQCLTCLEHLWISGCTRVEGLHETLQHMTALQSLGLWDLPNLESLPDCFENLGLLSKLTIGYCSKLTCLPMSLSLSSLKSLRIDGCPELQKQCQKEMGKDWPKIAHIPHIEDLDDPTSLHSYTRNISPRISSSPAPIVKKNFLHQASLNN
ncbi:putative disease resistance protein RGA4, partial [Mucuna pruriens]